MDREQALKVFGVDASASQQQIRKAFARVAIERADDRHAYDEALEAARLLGAIGSDQPASIRGTALTVRSSRALASVRRESLGLERLEQEQQKLRHERAQAEIDEIVRVRVDPLRRARRRYAWLAAVSTLVSAIALLLRGVGGLHGISNAWDNVVVDLSIVCVTLGASTGVLAAASALQVQVLDGAFQDVAATLSRRVTLAAALSEILDDTREFDDGSPITERDLEGAVSRWIFARPSAILPWPFGRRRLPPRGLYLLARRMGSHAFVQLLVSKGKECDLIDEWEALDVQGRLIAGYRIDVVPRTTSRTTDAGDLAATNIAETAAG
jgi:hypothetical protein